MYDWAEFRHFVYLLTILEKGGLRSAAEQLNTSQPNLSVQARQFQEYASVTLYRRTKEGRIQPTDTGLAFIELARMVLEVRNEAIEAIVAIERGEIDFIRLGCSPFADIEIFRNLCALHKNMLPRCTVRPTHTDTVQLAEGILSGQIDAAIVTLPLKHSDLRVEAISHDRLVVCLRKDSPLADKSIVQLADLEDNLSILYHPQRHPDAHARLLALLGDAGIQLREYSSASHPTEMQMLVKEGYGVALIREGMSLDEALTTRRIAGVEWTVDTAIAFHRHKCPKTVPIVVRKLRKQMRQSSEPLSGNSQHVPVRQNLPHHSMKKADSRQLSLLD